MTMRVPIEWLKQFVTIRATPKALAERLTMAGLEVTGIEPRDGSPVLELEITPNRADCLSIIGVAREVAALTNQRLKAPQGRRSRVEGRRPLPPSTFHLRAHLKIRIEDRTGCRRYIGRLLDGVMVGPSPAWMQRRLIACGARPINNVVDITNYVLLEYGQPLHAFDFDRLAGGTLLVRRASPREPLTTLDGVARTLEPEMLVIADANHAVAVAGVMGGIGSEVTGTTKRVLLESAQFDPVTIRRTARRLGLSSESSYRFERGVDPVGVETASARATALIAELAGGMERTMCDAGQRPPTRTVVALDGVRMRRWLGTPILPTTARTMLAKLSCRVASSGDGETLRVTIPSFRRDLTHEVDLYEELARMIGYERIPATLPTVRMAVGRPEAADRYRRLQSLRCLCASLGLAEAITWALVSAAELIRCGCPTSQAVRLANPLSQDHAFLRPSLLVGLLRSVRHNLAQGMDSARLFELGHVFGPQGAEQWRVGIALSGWWVHDWQHRQRCDFFRLKGLIETLVERVCSPSVQWAAATPPWAEPGQAATIQCRDRAMGTIGQVSRRVAAAWDIETELSFAELSVEELLAVQPTRTMHPPALFPPVKRDLSLIVGDEVLCDAVTRTIREVAGPLVGSVRLIDRYAGAQVPHGKHSLTFSLEYRDPARTLTAEAVDTLHRRIGQTLLERFGTQLR